MLLKSLHSRYTAVLSAAWQARHGLAGPRRLASERAFLPAVLSLQETPVHPAPRRIIGLIALFCLTTLVWATLGKLDVVTIAPGRIIVSERSKVIQPLEAAVVSAIHVRDGQTVQAGQLLITLDPTQVLADDVQNAREWVAAMADKLQAQHLYTALQVEAFTAPSTQELNDICVPLAASHCINSTIFIQQLSAAWADLKTRKELLTAAVETKNSEVEVAKAAVQRIATLLDSLKQRETDMAALAHQGFISQHGLQDRTRDRQDLENELRRVQASLNTAQRALHEAHTEKRAFKANTLNALLQRNRTAQQELEQVEQNLLKSQQRLRLHELRAPVEGVVQQLAVHTLGGVVSPAQALMVVVPSQQELIAEVMIPNKDIGFIYPGQVARIKVETFNFTRYGTLDATVAWVSADALTQDPQNPSATANNPASNGLAPVAYFPAHIQLRQNSLAVEDKKMPITPGMNVTAEIKTGRRSVLDYFLSPIRKTLSESAGER